MKRKLTKNLIPGVVAAALLVPAIAFSVLNVQPVKADSTNGKILYVGSRDLDGNDDEIYVMDADGANQTKITNNTDYEYEPGWSADGTKVVFTSDRDGDEEIFVMNLDGTNEVKLTNNSSDDSFAVWAPDNSKIIFVSDRDGNQELYSMNIDGSNQTRLTNNSADDYLPAWAPTSDRVVFVSERDGGDSDIFTMDPDGTNLAQLTANANPDTEPDWSPDGTKIAYEAGSVPGTNIYVMNSDGTGQTAITNVSFPITNNYPSWSIDGTKIAFASNRDTNGDEIYVMDADGSNEVQLTNIAPDFNYNTNPDWGGNDTTGGGGSSDTDGDGVSDTIESAGPNAGDANNDSIADSTQASVTGMVNPITGKYVVLQSSCTSNSNVGVTAENSSFKDAAFEYAAGLVEFTLTCSSPGATANVALYMYGGVNGTAVRKYNSVTHTYQAIEGASLSNLTIAGQTVTRATYQITDGSSLDQDATANGTIVDPVGIGRVVIGAPQTGLGRLLE
ncbi:MAG TPA: choice-of-anchor U domain-containing protein [Candidatus Saccharimonadales bacterium]